MKLVKMPAGKPLGWTLTDYALQVSVSIAGQNELIVGELVSVGTVIVKDARGNLVQGHFDHIDDLLYAKLVSKYGVLSIGFNGKYGQWAFEENGGAVMVPYTISPDGELLVAGGYEIRLLINDGDSMFTPPGGFSLNQENPEDAAKRETLEETGVHVNSLIKVGEGTPNRAFWIKQPDGNWPQSFFACKVEFSALAEKDGQVYLPSTEGAIAELDKLSKLVFIPVLDAIDNTNDEIAITAFSKTMTAYKKGRIF